TSTITPTATMTPTVTETSTSTPTNTEVPPGSTITVTPTISETYTHSPTASPTSTITLTTTPTDTETPMPPDTTTATASPSATMTVTPFTNVQLVLEKTANLLQASEGDIIRYTILFENQGAAFAWNTKITDKIPDFTHYYQGTGNTGISGLVQWSGVVAPGYAGEVWFDVQVEAALPNTPINNIAYIISDNSNTVASNTVTTIWMPPPTPTSIPNLVGENEIIAYPNPVWGDSLTFLFLSPEDAEAKVRIYNSAGKLVREIQCRAMGGVSQKLAWEVGDIPPGVYIYQLLLNNKSVMISKLAVVKRK
ncbi:T9SS type A sorting domain-containing protein, partial [candidate division FCPU426 bacterium]|nr:T9SS type A sorting domain-containing protein [candidate division FCPU426 bacterium]